MTEHTHRALVVDDDDQIVEVVEDCLESLGHTYDRAASQAEARELLAAQRYCYVLLDLEIPVKLKRIPRIQSGQNLLEEIRGDGWNARVPIIVMTSHGTDGPSLAVETMKKGADDYVCKPFPSGSSPESLDAKIKQAIEANAGRCAGAGQDGDGTAEGDQPVATRDAASLRPFRGGELVFYANRVELLGRAILRIRSDTKAHKVLRLLAKKLPNGKYVSYSGKDLAAQVDPECGQNSVAGWIKNLRQSVRKVMEGEGYRHERGDVIRSGGRGYRFIPWIEVRNEYGELFR